MTYGQFLLIFVGMPLVGVTAMSVGCLKRFHIGVLAALSLVALAYTAPWDNAIVLNGVWSYGRGKVLGIVFGHVPLEEYLFYVLQVFLTGIFTVRVLAWLRD